MPDSGLTVKAYGSSRPLAPFARRLVEVAESRQVGAYSLLACVDEGGPAPRAGQFYMLAAETRWGGGEDGRPFLPRAFSVFRHREPSVLEFLFENIGPGTQRLGDLVKGERLWILGPLGNGFAFEGKPNPILVGGGVGIAPLAILTAQLSPAQPRVLLGFRDAECAQGAGLFNGAEIATDDGSTGHHGRVIDLLVAHLEKSGQNATVFACGPPQMLEAVRVVCVDKNVPAQLALESPMACGFGACFGCVVPTKNGFLRLCVDGPVLSAGDLETCLIPGTEH